MGKVRIRTLGIESEETDKKKQKEKREKKKVAKAPGLHGGERVVAVGPTEEELAKELSETPKAEEPQQAQSTKQPKKAKSEPKVASKRYSENKALVAKNTAYPLGDSIEILRKFKKSKFDETVELHVNVKEKGLSGTLTLPHGTGKKFTVRVADDELITEVEQGKINFDILVAHPSMMDQLAKIARVLGPRGLMPNPKNGTISDKPQEAVEKFSKGVVSYKTESQAPIIHLSIGKLSFTDEKLLENIQAAVAAIGASKIGSATLKSTMSPAIKLQI